MSNIWVIARKEYKQFFTSPIAYAITFTILAILGIRFFVDLIYATNYSSVPDFRSVVELLILLLIFFTPGITMRAIADESRMGTLELMMTAPVRDWEFIVGKWLGSFLFVFTILLITWVYPLILNQVIQPGIDQGMLVTVYLGLILMTGAMVSVGIKVSSWFSNQIAAFFATIGILLVLWFIGYPSSVMTGGGGEIFRYLDVPDHFYNSFYLGVIELKDMIYFISLTSLALFLGTLSIDLRRWR